ncbi:MAG: hypothetical protein HYW34_03840 [Candidatus Brennerbacteria bacterium]|nr:hypothetical protein [Candidatus Brennerbacteria bacterium]
MKGFSLIETIIYAALISIIIGMVLLVVFQIVESQDRSRAKTEVEEETNFLISKIKWALSGVDVINIPAGGSTSSTLSINKFNFSQNPIVISLASGSLELAIGSSAPAILNSGSVSVPNISFQHIAQTSTTAPAIKTTLSVQYNPRGAYRFYETLSTVETTIYLRK